jgi:hypothetical protein
MKAVSLTGCQVLRSEIAVETALSTRAAARYLDGSGLTNRVSFRQSPDSAPGADMDDIIIVMGPVSAD